MNRLPFLAGCAAMLLLGGCGGDDAGTKLEPTTAVAPTVAPATSVPGVASGLLGDGASLRSTDGKLELRTSGKPVLNVSVKVVQNGGPGAPKGWAFATPIYDITARDNERPVTKLNDAFELAFSVTSGPATVMYHDGKDWIIVESESDGRGSVTARTDHLAPFVVANPTSGTVTRVSATATATSAVPTAAKATPIAQPTQSGTRPAGTPEPSATAIVTAPKSSVTASPVDLNMAASALKTAVDRFKGKSVKITGATGYAGTGTIPLPASIETAIASVAAQGELFYGFYKGVNEALTSGATAGGAAGTFSLLVEPKTTFPATTTEAQAQLATIFPGATGLKYAPSVSNSNTYTYFATSGTTVYVMGYITYQGLPMAFLSVGFGAYYGLAFGTGSLQ